MTDMRLDQVRFGGTLRPAQASVAEVARRQLKQGEHRLHVVAPPGSGKTVLGLYVWAELVRRPAVVLSPNSAIQSQWGRRAAQFCRVQPEDISHSPLEPGLFTSLTYQSVTLPRSPAGSVGDQALQHWRSRLVEAGEATTEEEASFWIRDLERHNPDYWRERLGIYARAVRDERARSDGGTLDHLHERSREALDRLRAHGVGLVILDECHHLLGHWGRVLRDAYGLLDSPVVLGLTATPPDLAGTDPRDVDRYRTFFGPVDFEIPVPALVRDGHLAPYQDLVYFVRPTPRELSFLSDADKGLADLVRDLSTEPTDASPRVPLPAWVEQALAKRSIGIFTADTWAEFERRDPGLARAGPWFLARLDHALPAGVPAVEVPAGEDPLPLTVTLVDRYVRHHLRRTPCDGARALEDRAERCLRLMGTQITETGSRACASPVNRVMGYSRSKVDALLPVLRGERRALGEAIRAVVVADYEKTSAVESEIRHLLDHEAGGAVAAFRALLEHEETDALDPVLVTGSTVLVDDDLRERFSSASEAWLAEHGYGVEFRWEEQGGFHVLLGSGGDWSPRVYVAMVTALFQEGVTKCLVGTRGLLGEGWDASRINVLLDLTTVTTSTSVNQLRGRSIRLDPDAPRKVADNWDVVCLAPEFVKGLDDYHRFRDKHRALYGVTDDAAIEKGVGHVHPAFTDLKPEGVEGSAAWLNSEMLSRIGRREETREQWKVGTPYRAKPVRAVEFKAEDAVGGGFPPFGPRDAPWSGASLSAAIGRAVLDALVELGRIEGGALHAGDRGDGYVRLFLEGADEAAMELFCDCVCKILGPIDRPRYLVPRFVREIEATWLSNILPEVVGRYFTRKRKRLAMWHAVPKPLAVRKDTVQVFQPHWNRRVSPGEAVYVHRGQGVEILERVRAEGLGPRVVLREKDVFL